MSAIPQKQTVAKTAATFVVDPVSGEGDFTDIQTALNALLAIGGGKLLLRQGTYSISTTLTLPNADVVIQGSGHGTLIDIGANAIAAFTAPFARNVTFRDFQIDCGDVAGQVGFDFTLGGAMPTARIENVWVSDISPAGTHVEIIVRAVAGTTFTQLVMTDCIFHTRFSAASRILSKPTAGGSLYMTRVRTRGDGGIDQVQAHLSECEINVANEITLGSGSIITACTFIGGTGSINCVGSLCRFTVCRFANTGNPQILMPTGFHQVIGCEFVGGASEAIDITAQTEIRIEGSLFFNNGTPVIDIGTGATKIVVTGCIFDAPSAEAIRTAGTNGVVSGNQNCPVLETGAADFNTYTSNSGFNGSTIIGPDSVVDNLNTRLVNTTPVTLTRDDRTVLVNSAGGNRLLNLPAAATVKYHVFIIKKIAAVNTVTIDPAGAETIDGAATLVLTDDDVSAILQSDGVEYHILGEKGIAVGAGAADFAQLSDSTNQEPSVTTPVAVTLNTNDSIQGISHSTTVNPDEVTVNKAGSYLVAAQAQVGRTGAGTAETLDIFLQVNRAGGGFVDEPNSNIKYTIKDQDLTDVIVSMFTLDLASGDKFRFMQRVSDETEGLGLKATAAEVGPPTIPATPSIIMAIQRVPG